MQAARSYSWPGCTGFIELDRWGSSWAADLAHDRAYLGCECSLLDEETVIIPLTRAHRRSDSHDHEDFLVCANYKVFTIMKRGARIGI